MSLAKVLIGGVRVLFRDLTHAETVLSLALYARMAYSLLLRRRLRTLDSELAFGETLRHNMKSLFRKLNRMKLLIRPLSVLENVRKDARILVIGPRNEWDLLLLHQAGFDFRMVTGLDLISYSPKIILGDMHEMPFPDGHFDVVLCGWTLSYSARPADACREIARVCGKDGVIAIGVEYFDGSDADERAATGGYLLHDDRLPERVNSVSQILAMFPAAGDVYFACDAPLRRSAPASEPPSNCLVLFRNVA